MFPFWESNPSRYTEWAISASKESVVLTKLKMYLLATHIDCKNKCDELNILRLVWCKSWNEWESLCKLSYHAAHCDCWNLIIPWAAGIFWCMLVVVTRRLSRKFHFRTVQFGERSRTSLVIMNMVQRNGLIWWIRDSLLGISKQYGLDGRGSIPGRDKTYFFNS
jgi:hypothetical protein